MKKLFAKIITVVLAGLFLVVCGCDGCNKDAWKKTDVTLKDWGEVVSNGSFVAETKNYLYVINGAGDSADSNRFGNPVKGALLAVSKADIEAGKSADEIEKNIVVPKLFVASDYNSGVYIFGDYVYYGTPSTDKDSSGKEASNELEFMKTKLDGTETVSFFKTEALTDEYRMVDVNGVVYIVAYDSTNSELVSYNTQTKEKKVVAKVDEKAEEESLLTCSFVDVASASAGVVFYTVNVYKEAYNQSVIDAGGTRAQASYNKVYAYKAGEENAVCVLDGKDSGTTYAITLIKNGYVFYTATKSVGINTEENLVNTVSDLYNKKDATAVANKTYVSKDNIIVSLDEVYTKNSDGTAIRKTTLTGNIVTEEKTVATVSTATTLLFKQGDFIYYINGDNYLARIKIDNVNAENDAEINEQVVSDSTVPTEWFMPKVVDDGKFIVYSDNSALGCTYAKVVAINSDNIKTETDDDGEFSKCYLTGQKQICVFAKKDNSGYAEAKINDIDNKLENGKLVFDEEKDADGNVKISAIEDARKLYDALSKKEKKAFNEDTLNKLVKYEYAYKLYKAFNKLDGFDTLSDDDKNAKKADYENAVAIINEISETEIKVDDVRNLIENNANYYYQQATEFFK